jgi:mono/diheme cytochrome c family protein
MKHVIFGLAGLALALGTAAAQQPAPAGNAGHGRMLYREVGCYACHGLAGQGAQATGPRLLRTQLPFEGFMSQLRHPQSQMPPYETAVLPDEDAADIYAFLRQLPAPPGPESIPLLKREP